MARPLNSSCSLVLPWNQHWLCKESGDFSFHSWRRLVHKVLPNFSDKCPRSCKPIKLLCQHVSRWGFVWYILSWRLRYLLWRFEPSMESWLWICILLCPGFSAMLHYWFEMEANWVSLVTTIHSTFSNLQVPDRCFWSSCSWRPGLRFVCIYMHLSWEYAI